MKQQIIRALWVMCTLIPISCAETQENQQTDLDQVPGFRQLTYSDISHSFNFQTPGSEEAVFPIIRQLEELWGKANVYPVQIRRNQFGEFFQADEQLADYPDRPHMSRTAYSYLFLWLGVDFPESSGTGSISVFVNPVVLSSPRWEDHYPMEWDSIVPFRAIEVTEVEIRISPDKVNPFKLNPAGREVFTSQIQSLVENELGSPTKFMPSQEDFVNFMESFQEREVLRKRLPPEMQDAFFPLVGIPQDRDEIDLRLSFSYPLNKAIEYQILLKDMAGQLIDHQM
ncbi:MAG: hypothetical protein AAF206_08590, partial [Bacteroidota bacterium]